MLNNSWYINKEDIDWMKNDCKECINSKRMEIVTKYYMKGVLVVGSVLP